MTGATRPDIPAAPVPSATATGPSAPVSDAAVDAALAADAGWVRANPCGPTWTRPPCAQVRRLLEGAVPLIRAAERERAEAAEAERDRFREQARILGGQKAEWLCEPCAVIHPWRDGDRFTAACPDCGGAMVPTSISARALQEARAKLATIAALCREHPRTLTAEDVLRITGTGEEARDG